MNLAMSNRTICFALCLAALPAQERTGTPRLVQGPMLGAVTPDSIRIWMRPAGPFPCVVEYARDAEFTEPLRSEAVVPSRERDYTVCIVLQDLQPATRYHYRVRVAGAVHRPLPATLPCTFTTAPVPESAGRVRIAFGSCARIDADAEQPIWHRVREAAPDLFLWIGDNVYANTVLPDILREEYRRQRAVPSLQPLLRTVPQLAVWDDHDFGCNNDDRTNPIRAEALAVFGEYWANPPREADAGVGVYFRYRLGGVELFMLDDRYHRAPNEDADEPTKTMLGAEQLAWLQRALESSRAPFKLLVSGSGWTCAKGPGGDSWAAFLHERNRLFDFIRDQGIEGVVLVSGDTHVAELNAIPRAAVGGYDLYDLVSSPLAQPASDNFRDRTPELRIRAPYCASANFGLIECDTTGTPTLRFTVIGVDGRAAWTPLELTVDDLRNGVESWPRTIDARERARQQAAGVLPKRRSM